jgi:hypothetical protein
MQFRVQQAIWLDEQQIPSTGNVDKEGKSSVAPGTLSDISCYLEQCTGAQGSGRKKGEGLENVTYCGLLGTNVKKILVISRRIK